MLPRCSVFIATSLDGQIARADGAIDWLEAANTRVPPGEDCGYGEFIAGIDTLVMGRHSAEQVLAFPQWPYGELPVVVLSRSGWRPPAGAPATLSVSDETPRALALRLGARGLRHLYIDGGATVRAFLDAGLVQELVITTVPVLIGAGRPLFGARGGDLDLELVSSRSWPFGFVQNRYRVRGPVEPAA